MNVYQENIKRYNDQIVQLNKAFNRISLLRLIVFIISATLLIALFSTDLTIPFLIGFIVSILCFILVLKHHTKIEYLRNHTSFLKRINESEILREQCNLQEFESGDKFINPNHPYTSDLDIFGQHSIFQLLNRTTTESAMILLSEWLLGPAADYEIADRQNAIKELSPKLQWRQDFQASGMHFQNKKSAYNKLLDWVKAPVLLLKYQLVYRMAAIILSGLSLTGLYFFLANLNAPGWYIYLYPLFIVLFINYMILRKVKSIAEDIAETSQENINTLKGYRTLINKIESATFRSKKLCQLQSILTKSQFSASNEINRLCRILEFSQQKGIKNKPIGGNPFYSIFNRFLLLDIHLIIATEKWKSKNKAFLKSWAEAVSAFEVINSLAGYSYSNPSYTFPEITEKNNTIHFESLGHPLINPGKRVCNNFHSEGNGNVVMITGSNMGGKSTFLRTVGVNLVLALAGAPCCAKQGQVSRLKLYTSMRTQDNLKEGVSSFYAELDRIEKMLKMIKSCDNVFFLLDEMFKGTNSEDRHKGGFSLINQISRLATSGIVATHDIALARLLEKRSLVTNYSFNSAIKKDSMHFSYQLQPGICIDFNASELMKRSGIKIISDMPGK